MNLKKYNAAFQKFTNRIVQRNEALPRLPLNQKFLKGGGKKLLFLLPLICLIFTGCQTTVDKVQEFDKWIHDNLW